MKLVLEETIAAAPADVFRVFTDLAMAPERIDSIQSLELLGKGPVGKGTRFRETRVMFGKEATEEMEITEFDPPRSYTVEAESCGVHYHSRYTFDGTQASTKVLFTMSTRPASLMGRVMGPVFGVLMKGSMRKAMEQDHAQLKAVCEGAGGH